MAKFTSGSHPVNCQEHLTKFLNISHLDWLNSLGDFISINIIFAK